jgi:autotransporter-associated beta strand protein
LRRQSLRTTINKDFRRPPRIFTNKTISPYKSMNREPKSKINLLLIAGITLLANLPAAYAAPSSYQSTVLADSPYVYYRLGEASGTAAADTSGNAYAGTYVGTPTLAVAGANGGDTAVTFNGTSQYVNSPATTNFGFSMANSSYEFVFKTTSTARGALVGTLDFGSGDACVVTVNENAAGAATVRNCRIFLRDATAANAVGASFANTAITNGEYHHLVFVYNSSAVPTSSRVRAYLDGVEQTITYGATSGTGIPASFNTITNTPLFGARHNRSGTTPSVDYYFSGTMDEAVLHPTSLSAAAVAAHYQAFLDAGNNLSTNLAWAVGNGTWDIDTTANWTNGTAMSVYSESNGIGNRVTFNDTATGSSPIAISLNTTVNPATITNNSTKNYTLSGAGNLAGSGGITKSGSGTLTLNLAGTSTFTGPVNLNGGILDFAANNLGGATPPPITFNGGTLRYSSGNTDDASMYSVTFTGNATIDVGANDVTFTKAVGNNGAGSLTKLGAGALYLTSTNRYAGDTLINGGTLGLSVVGGIASLGSSTNIILSSGATFDTVNNGGYSLAAAVGQTLSGVGSVNGDLTVPVGTTISPATGSTVGTLVFTNNLTLGGTLLLNVTTTGRDQLLVGGFATINSGTVLTVPTPALTNGSYKLIQADQGLSGLANFTLNFTQTGKSGSLVVQTDGSTNTLYLVVATSVSDDITWAGVGTDWDQAGTLNWYLGTSVTPWAFTNGATVRFNETGVANTSVALTAVVNPSLVVVSNSTDYFFNDGGGKISGAARLEKRNSGKLTIATGNDNTGATTILGGTLEVSGDIGSGPVTNNAQLVFTQGTDQSVASVTGTGSLTQSGSATLTVAGTANYTGSTVITGGALQIGTGGAAGVLSTSAITNDGNLILNSSNSWSLTMPDTGTGILTKQGTGTLTLNGPHSRTGSTRVEGGKVILGGANYLLGPARVQSGGTLDINGFNQSFTGLESTPAFSGGVIINSGITTNTITVTNDVAYDCSAAVTNGSGVIAFVKDGPASLNWRGANTYSGGSTLKQGTVTLTTGSPFGTGPVNMTGGAISLAGANANIPNTINLLAPVTTNIMGSANISGFTGPMVGTGDVSWNWGSGNGTLTLSGGATQFAGLTNTFYLRSTTSGFFRYGGGGGARGVTFDLTDSFVTISSSGIQTIELGALVGNTNTATLWASAGSSYIIGAKNLSTTFAGRLAGAPANNNLVKVGAGTLTLAGTNLFTGALTVSNATLALTLDAAPSGMTPITVVSGATLDVTGLADLITETNELGEVTNSFHVVNSTLSLGTNIVAQTLRGGGNVNGNVVAGTNATVSPGINSLGTLTLNNALTLNGTSFMELNRTNAGQTNDLIAAASVAAGGTLTVTNLGPALRTGDKFKLFSVPVTGAFSVTNLPLTFVDDSLVVQNYQWTNKLAIDGTIEVLVGYVPVPTVNTNPPPLLSSYAGGVLSLSWPTNSGWTLQEQTNSRSIGLSTNWVDVPGSTSITSTNITVAPSKPTVFYRLKL